MHPGPPSGLVHLSKLTNYFVDQVQLKNCVLCIDHYLSKPFDPKDSNMQYSLLRVLAMTGESCKYLSPSTKSLVPIPWKNIEKVRDFLSHASRVPMRKALQQILGSDVQIIATNKKLPNSDPNVPKKKAEEPVAPVPPERSAKSERNRQSKLEKKKKKKWNKLISSIFSTSTLLFILILLIGVGLPIAFLYQQGILTSVSLTTLDFRSGIVLFLSFAILVALWWRGTDPTPTTPGKVASEPDHPPEWIVPQIANHDVPELSGIFRYLIDRQTQHLYEYTSKSWLMLLFTILFWYIFALAGSGYRASTVNSDYFIVPFALGLRQVLHFF